MIDAVVFDVGETLSMRRGNMGRGLTGSEYLDAPSHLSSALSLLWAWITGRHSSTSDLVSALMLNVNGARTLVNQWGSVTKTCIRTCGHAWQLCADTLAASRSYSR